MNLPVSGLRAQLEEMAHQLKMRDSSSVLEAQARQERILKFLFQLV